MAAICLRNDQSTPGLIIFNLAWDSSTDPQTMATGLSGQTVRLRGASLGDRGVIFLITHRISFSEHMTRKNPELITLILYSLPAQTDLL